MIIATANSKGGVGKTTLAVHLAGWLHAYGFPVALADCDAQRLSSRWLSEALPDVPAFSFSCAAEVLNRLPELHKQFDVVVADGPAGLEEVSRAILLRAHAVLVPTRASRLELNALSLATETLRQVQDIREGTPAAVVVVNQVNDRYRLTHELPAEAQQLGFPVAETVVHQRQLIAQSARIAGIGGRLLWQMGRRRAVREGVSELDTLFREVFPEVAEADPTRLMRLVRTNNEIHEEANEQVRIARSG